MNPSQHPELSVVVAIVSDTTTSRASVDHLADCLDALAHQEEPPITEVIVPYHQNVDGIDQLRQLHPEIQFVAVTDLPSASFIGGSREHHDTLRARGLAAAKGRVVALLEDHEIPDRRWCANTVAAHRDGAAVIGGAIDNGIDRPLNWAVYYCDFGKYQNPLPSGDSAFASDANVTYKRDALESVRPTWEQRFREVVVNAELIARGENVTLNSTLVAYQNRKNLRVGAALRERFIWGRSYAAVRNEGLTRAKRIVYAALAPLLPVILMKRIAQTAWSRRAHFRRFLRASHWIALLLVAWSAGECVGYFVGLNAVSSPTSPECVR